MAELFGESGGIEELKVRYGAILRAKLDTEYKIQTVTDADLEVDEKCRALMNPKTGNTYFTASGLRWRRTVAELRVGGPVYIEKVFRESIDSLIGKLRECGFDKGATITMLEGPKAWVEVRGKLVEGECYFDVENTVGCEPPPTVREKLAAYAHEAWSGWMKYMFGKCEDEETYGGGSCTAIPKNLVERWTRQMNTPYADLPESEKKSDRDEADKMLRIMEGK